MLARYDDILDTMNRLLREAHTLEAEETKFFPDGCTGEVGELVDGAPERPCECIVHPQWYDENGCPRFAPHHPALCPNIYAREVALLLIRCQACEEEFHVQMSVSYVDKEHRLSTQVKNGHIHYGDPPPHADCHAGATMNCDDVRVIEFWRCPDGKGEWSRDAEFEVEIVERTDAR